MYVYLTDNDWYHNLASANYSEINFWLPGSRGFSAISEGELLLFKLHSPYDFIVGGGFFLRHLRMPVSVAWNAYKDANGMPTQEELLKKIYRYRETSHSVEPDPEIGCVLLSQPFFFPEKDWIPVPKDWSKNIVKGKRYSTEDHLGKELFNNISYHYVNAESNIANCNEEDKENMEKRFGEEMIIRPRLGQASFRLLVLDAYSRRCAITGEKTTPVLQAAHIKPYSEGGQHLLENGLSLRSDFHVLFDNGYLTVDPQYTIHVSKRIKEEYGNGREYYSYDRKKLLVLPQAINERPSIEYLQWHNDLVFVG